MDSFWAELEKIAQTRHHHVFVALDKVANVATSGGSIEAPGSSNMPGKSYGGPSMGGSVGAGNPGAVNIPGMSWHCTKCGSEIKRQTVQKGICPKCGGVLRPAKDLKNNGTGDIEATNEEEELDNPEGGGDTEKNAGAKMKAVSDSVKKWMAASKAKMTEVAPKAKRVGQVGFGTAVLGGGGYAGYALGSPKGQGGDNYGDPYAQAYGQKMASARQGNPIMNIRKGHKSIRPSQAVVRQLDGKITATTVKQRIAQKKSR